MKLALINMGVLQTQILENCIKQLYVEEAQNSVTKQKSKLDRIFLKMKSILC